MRRLLDRLARACAAAVAALRAALEPREVAPWRDTAPDPAPAAAPLPGTLPLKTDQRFQQLFQHSSEGLLVCAADGRILAGNPVVSHWLGAERQSYLLSPLAAHLKARSGDDGTPLLAPGHKRCHLHTLRGEPMAVDVFVSAAVHKGQAQWLVHLRDASDREKADDRLSYLVNYDSLTGLPNRSLFRDRLQLAMERSKRSNQPMALMCLGLDRFKLVNDSLGQDAGDRLLKHVAHTLTQCLRATDSLSRPTEADAYTLSRLGGDEFTVIVEPMHSAEDAALIAQRLLDSLGAPFLIGEDEVFVSASIGIASYPATGTDMDALISQANRAMTRSKVRGRGVYSFSSDDLNTTVSARLSLESSLRRALERNEFRLVYQPKADLRSGLVTGVEALIRWQCPVLGMVPPDQFISVLEETGLILPVGAWVIRTACADLAAWDRMKLGPLHMAVNLSARQFHHQFLATLVEDTLRENDIEPQRIELELTESLLMEDSEQNRGTLSHFARIGVRVAIDDFGTGHSSLAYLKRFNIDTLKIDRSFVKDLPGNSDDAAIATAIIALGHSLQMKIVAEGVETQDQADMLADLGCDSMQGYLLGRPMPKEQFVIWLLAQRRKRAQLEQDTAFGNDTEVMPLLDLAEPPALTPRQTSVCVFP